MDEDAVIEAMDVEHTIYEAPLEFAAQDLDQVIIDQWASAPGRRNLKPWREYVDRVINAEHRYHRHRGQILRALDAYKSIHESLNHAGAAHTKVKIKSVSAEDIEKKGAEAILADVDGILVPGGFGARELKARSRR